MYRKSQRVEPAANGIGIHAGIEQGGERHVTADAAETIEMQSAHKKSSCKEDSMRLMAVLLPLGGRGTKRGGSFPRWRFGLAVSPKRQRASKCGYSSTVAVFGMVKPVSSTKRIRPIR